MLPIMIMAKGSFLPSGDDSDYSHVPTVPPNAVCQEAFSNSIGWINQRTCSRGLCPVKHPEAKSSLKRQQSGLEDGSAGRNHGPTATEREVQVGAPAVNLQLLIVPKGRGIEMSR